MRTLYSLRDSQIAYPMGYAATTAIRISDGETIFAARRFSSDSADLRRLLGGPTFVVAVAASMVSPPPRRSRAPW